MHNISMLPLYFCMDKYIYPAVMWSFVLHQKASALLLWRS